jgi:hypothetical protein
VPIEGEEEDEEEEFCQILSQMQRGVHYKCLLSLSDFNQSWVFSIVCREVIKFHENSSSGS